MGVHHQRRDMPEGFEAVIHPSLMRPALLMGAERNFVLINLSLSVILYVLSGYSFGALPKILALSVSLHLGSVALGKRDPHLARVLVRHLRLRTFYPPRALASAPVPMPRV